MTTTTIWTISIPTVWMTFEFSRIKRARYNSRWIFRSSGVIHDPGLYASTLLEEPLYQDSTFVDERFVHSLIFIRYKVLLH